MFERILLAYDGSCHAQRALAMAQELAQKFGASVRIVYAFHPISLVLGNPLVEQAMQRETAHGTELVSEAAEHLRAAGLDPHVEVLEGPPADAILRVAAIRQSDLIIMGSRGLGDAAAMFMGSVSHKVLHSAKCPVLIMK
jgi:nucleotide-binding universal stress UspA family protein